MPRDEAALIVAIACQKRARPGCMIDAALWKHIWMFAEARRQWRQLNFWFNQNPFQDYPLIALQFASTAVAVSFAEHDV